MSQLERIKEKLDYLRFIDQDFKIFGADSHKYIMNSCLAIEKIHFFENQYNVQLPYTYVDFLTKIGNGGAGPFYGLNTLEDSRILYFDSSEKENHIYYDLSKPFPHTIAWNLDEEVFEKLYNDIEDAYQSGDEALEEELNNQKWDLIGEPHHDFGRLSVCDYGCGIYISLIVNGEEKGNIWTDDRTNDGGIYPFKELGNLEKLSFLDWYEFWLDKSIKTLTTPSANTKN